MLLANMSVAKKIYESFPTLSLLRKHPEPKLSMLYKMVDVLKKHGKALHYLKDFSVFSLFLKWLTLA